MANSAASDYGSALRDDAAMLALAAESGARAAPGRRHGRCASMRARALSTYTWTQEDAWLLLRRARSAKESGNAI